MFQPLQTSQRIQVVHLGTPQIQGFQCRQTAQRGQVAHLGTPQIQGFQCRQPTKRGQVAHLGPPQIQGFQSRQYSDGFGKLSFPIKTIQAPNRRQLCLFLFRQCLPSVQPLQQGRNVL